MAKAKSKTTEREVALEALARFAADPTPRVLMGTAKAPGVFQGSGAAIKAVAQLCEREKWIEETGATEGKGPKAKKLVRLTPAGLKAVLEEQSDRKLLEQILGALDAYHQELSGIRSKLDAATQLIERQKQTVAELARKASPDLDAIIRRALTAAPEAVPVTVKGGGSDDAWLDEALRYLKSYKQRNPYGRCPLPELYLAVAKSRGLTIGQFHDGIRQLVDQARVAWHPYTGPAFRLEHDQYAIVAGQEIQYYVEPAS